MSNKAFITIFVMFAMVFLYMTYIFHCGNMQYAETTIQTNKIYEAVAEMNTTVNKVYASQMYVKEQIFNVFESLEGSN